VFSKLGLVYGAGAGRFEGKGSGRPQAEIVALKILALRFSTNSAKALGVWAFLRIAKSSR
jgi:hypothetical protein